jgi:hypothetical protein
VKKQIRDFLKRKKKKKSGPLATFSLIFSLIFLQSLLSHFPLPPPPPFFYFILFYFFPFFADMTQLPSQLWLRRAPAGNTADPRGKSRSSCTAKLLHCRLAISAQADGRVHGAASGPSTASKHCATGSNDCRKAWRDQKKKREKKRKEKEKKKKKKRKNKGVGFKEGGKEKCRERQRDVCCFGSESRVKPK